MWTSEINCFSFEVSNSTKSHLVRAAREEGSDLSAFVLDSALSRANEVIDPASINDISDTAKMNLFRLLSEEAKDPNQAMKDLRSFPRLTRG